MYSYILLGDFVFHAPVQSSIAPLTKTTDYMAAAEGITGDQTSEVGLWRDCRFIAVGSQQSVCVCGGGESVL